MGPRVELVGERQLRASLRRAGDDLSDLKAAHAAAARVVEPVARTAAPVRSGTLAGTVRSSGTKTAAIVRAGYASVPYAGPIHWGWPKRNISPNRFVWDAARRTQTRWLVVYRTAVDRIIRKVKGA